VFLQTAWGTRDPVDLALLARVAAYPQALVEVCLLVPVVDCLQVQVVEDPQALVVVGPPVPAAVFRQVQAVEDPLAPVVAGPLVPAAAFRQVRVADCLPVRVTTGAVCRHHGIKPNLLCEVTNIRSPSSFNLAGAIAFW
jgi:hypothetical protein